MTYITLIRAEGVSFFSTPKRIAAAASMLDACEARFVAAGEPGSIKQIAVMDTGIDVNDNSIMKIYNVVRGRTSFEVVT